MLVLSSRTRQQLSGHRSKTNYSEEASNDQFYVVETIVDIKNENGKKEFKIKWLGYPEVKEFRSTIVTDLKGSEHLCQTQE